MLELTPDELLSTSRTVRKRLDLAKPVRRAFVVNDRSTIGEIARLSHQGRRCQEYWDSQQAYDLIFGR